MSQRNQTFDWMTVSPRVDGGAAFRKQFEKAVRERARLLYNLKFSAADATKRITDALSWEFDTTTWPKMQPAFFAEVPGWVQAVYTQMTPTQA